MPTTVQRSGPTTIVNTSSRAGFEGNMVDSRSTTNGKPTAPAKPLASQNVKKTKNKKADEPVDHAKMVLQTISQIESKQAGDREQDLEIEREVKKTMRETSNELKSFEDNNKKFDALNEKYRELLFNMKRLDRDYRTYKRKAEQSQKERDTAKSEVGKLTTKNTRLESLSKELQKQNKELKNNVKQLQEEDARKRIDLQDRIENMSQDVEDIINTQEHAKSHSETFETDELFRQKFKSFIDQYELRELHFHSLLRTKDLELQYHIAKLEQHRRAQEMESNKSHQLTRQVSTFSQTETELRSQLNIYVEKFKQVEDTLNSSNDLFLTFRKEMEEMSKKTKRLEKENGALTRKHDATNQSIIKMAEERTRTQKELELLRKKNDNLEKLCRGMQAQGRGQALAVPQNLDIDQDEDGTESEFDFSDEDEDEDGSLDEDDDEDRNGSFEPPPVPPIATTPASGHSVRTNNQAMIGKPNGIKA